MDFITILKEKVFKRYSLHVVLNKEKQYTVVNYHYSSVNEKFFNDLEKDLLLPIEQKNFNFGFLRQDFKGFKNASVQAFIRQKPTLEEFNNVFHSFYKNIQLPDLMSALYIKSDYFGNVAHSVYQPYILYLLKQDFNSQNIYPQDFLSALHFNFPSNDNNYTELKECLYSFLDTNLTRVKEKITHNDPVYALDALKKFEISLYDSIGKFIKPHDMKLFNCFWNNILIKKTEQNMLTKINNTFVFNLNYAYLSDIYPSIINEDIAYKTSHFIHNVINKYLNDYLTVDIIKKEPGFSQFVAQFTHNIEPKNLPDIIDRIIDIEIQINAEKKSSGKGYNITISQQQIDSLVSAMKYLSLNNKLPAKSISHKHLKI